MMTEMVKLAGREWPVSLMAIKQNRIVVPAVLAVMPLIARIGTAVATKDANPLWFTAIQLTTEDFDLMTSAVYTSLTKATPGLSRNEFDNLEISIEELLAALPVVAQQTGLLKKTEEATPAGEAVAGNPSTSIASSSPTVQEQASNGPMS